MHQEGKPAQVGYINLFSYKWHKWNQRRNSLAFHLSPESHHANENVMTACVLSSSTSSNADSAWTHQTGILRDESTSAGLKHFTATKPFAERCRYVYCILYESIVISADPLVARGARQRSGDGMVLAGIFL